MKPEGEGYEQDTNHEEVGVLKQRVLGLDSPKLAHRLSTMAVALVDEPSHCGQNAEDNWSSNTT